MATALPAGTEPGTTHFGADGHFRKVLGLPTLVLLGLVYMVPLTIFTTYGSSPRSPADGCRWPTPSPWR
jgi:hypothetical protein